MPTFTTEIVALKNEIFGFYNHRQNDNYKDALGAGRVFSEAVCKLIIQEKIETGILSNPFTIDIQNRENINNVGVKINITNTDYEFQISDRPNASSPRYRILMLGRLIPVIKALINEARIYTALEILKDEGNPAHHATGGRYIYSENEWQTCEPELKYITEWLFDTYLANHEIIMPSDIKKALKNKLNRKYLTSNIPSVDLDEVFGRTDDLQEIVTILENQNKIVLVNGTGGIGKTFFSKAYLQKFKNTYDHIIYIEQLTTLIASFVSEPSLSQNLLLNFSLTATNEEKFDIIMNKLKNDFKEKSLMIIDNVDNKINMGEIA